MADAQADVVIIGAGMAGIAAAVVELQQRRNGLPTDWKRIATEAAKETVELQEKKNARKCVSMSGMGASTCKEMLHGLKLHVEVVNASEPRVSAQNKIHGFVWDMNRAENEQVIKYEGHLNALFGHLLSHNEVIKFVLVCVQKNIALLDIKDERLPFDLRGGADAVVVEYRGVSTVDDIDYLNGLRLVIELKKTLDDKNRKKCEAQAIAELLAANLKAPRSSAVVLLTDLNNNWSFMWVSDDHTIRKVELKEPVNAVAFVGAILAHDDDDLSVQLPFPGAPQLPKRGHLDTMLATIEEDGVLGEMYERYRAIASELGPDMSMAREIGWRIVKQMPVYASMYT